MAEYRHHVSGFFAHRIEADSAIFALTEKGLPRSRLQLIDVDSAPPANKPKLENNEVLANVIKDGAIGVGVGTGIGILGEVALVAANVTLFVASPLIAPLVMLGWGASMGGIVGAAIGAEADVEHKDGWLSDLIRDAVLSGQIVVVAETISKQETTIAKEIIEAAVGKSKDVSTV